MPFVEDLADPADGESHFVNFARRHQNFFVKAVAVTCSQWVIDDENRPAVGINITDPDNEIGIGSC